VRLDRWRMAAGAALAALYLAAIGLLGTSVAPCGGLPACLLVSLTAGAALTACLFCWQAALGMVGLSLAMILGFEGWRAPPRRLELAGYVLAGLAAVKLADRVRRQVRHTEERYRLLVESASDGIVLGETGGALLWANRRAAEIFGYGPAELAEMNLGDLIVREDAVCLCAALHGSGTAMRECAGRRKDGGRLAVEIGGRALSGGRFMAIIRDVTERRRIEEQIRASLREKEVLLREIHHRVKNNLQIISSILHLQARRISDPQALERFEDCLERVRSIALLHETLYRSQDLVRVDLAACARALVRQLASAYETGGAVRFDLRIEEVHLDLDAAMPCGLILSELVSNALRHAFPEGRPGTITVSLAARNGCVELTVSDDGVGLPDAVDLEAPATLGLELVRAFARQLRAEVRVRRGQGAEIAVVFPHKQAARRADDADDGAGGRG